VNHGLELIAGQVLQPRDMMDSSSLKSFTFFIQASSQVLIIAGNQVVKKQSCGMTRD
jgi:hypothetical protein